MTTTDDQLDQLLAEWYAAYQMREDTPAEWWCGDRPELVLSLERQIAEVRRVERLAAAVRAPLPPPASRFRPAEAGDEIGRFDRYRLLGRLGRGGMGEVYLAEDMDTGGRVAVKLRRTDRDDLRGLDERVRAEGRLMARAAGPHVMPVLRVGEADGVPFVVMPYLPGETLAARLARGALRPAEHRRLARQLTAAVKAIHACQVAHGDLKPGNVWLEVTAGGWRVRVIDFGLAAELDDPVGGQTGWGGTAGYQSPERAAGGPADERADWYAVAVTLAEAGGLLPNARPRCHRGSTVRPRPTVRHARTVHRPLSNNPTAKALIGPADGRVRPGWRPPPNDQTTSCHSRLALPLSSEPVPFRSIDVGRGQATRPVRLHPAAPASRAGRPVSHLLGGIAPGGETPRRTVRTVGGRRW